MQNNQYKIERIALEGMPNTRDLGGMPTKDGRTIRYKKLLRSGNLFETTEQDAMILKEEYRLEKVLDFRTGEERMQNPDRIIEGVSYIQIPILEEKALGITREEGAENNFVDQVLFGMLDGTRDPVEAAEEYMRQMYASFLQSSFARRAYRCFFGELRKGLPGSILWHCTAGKDRVGIGTMLLLEALGVEEELILADYLKVNEFVHHVIVQHSRLAAERTGREIAGTVIEKLFSVEASYLEAVYREIRRDFGSMENFLAQEMGLDAGNREKLRRLYLE